MTAFSQGGHGRRWAEARLVTSEIAAGPGDPSNPAIRILLTGSSGWLGRTPRRGRPLRPDLDHLPDYSARKAETKLGIRCQTGFAEVLAGLT
jgi:hypothetical protein